MVYFSGFYILFQNISFLFSFLPPFLLLKQTINICNIVLSLPLQPPFLSFFFFFLSFFLSFFFLSYHICLYFSLRCNVLFFSSFSVFMIKMETSIIYQNWWRNVTFDHTRSNLVPLLLSLILLFLLSLLIVIVVVTAAAVKRITVKFIYKLYYSVYQIYTVYCLLKFNKRKHSL